LPAAGIPGSGFFPGKAMSGQQRSVNSEHRLLNAGEQECFPLPPEWEGKLPTFSSKKKMNYRK